MTRQLDVILRSGDDTRRFLLAGTLGPAGESVLLSSSDATLLRALSTDFLPAKRPSLLEELAALDVPGVDSAALDREDSSTDSFRLLPG